MLRPAVVVAEATRIGSGKVGCNIEWRVSHRAAKMSRLRIIAEQGQRHASHESDIGQLLPLGWLFDVRDGRWRSLTHLKIPTFLNLDENCEESVLADWPRGF